jgi:hypothetical protein
MDETNDLQADNGNADDTRFDPWLERWGSPDGVDKVGRDDGFGGALWWSQFGHRSGRRC